MSRAAARAGWAALACASLLGARTAQAHLIPAGRGTVNVVGESVYAVLSVPVSAIQGIDDDRNGVVDAEEFRRHEADVKAEIDRRLAIADGSTPATTVRVDLVLSPQHDGASAQADQIVALKHAKLAAAPIDLRVRCDLFGASATEKELKITATRHPASGTETQVAALTPAAPEHAFFSPPAPPPPPAGAPRGALLPLGALAVAALLTRAIPGGQRREAAGDRRQTAAAGLQPAASGPQPPGPDAETP